MAKLIELFYGQSGTGKSEGIASIIEHMYEQEGLVSRVAIGDGSKATYTDRGLVDAGVVEVMDFSMRDWPLSTFARICEGWWPVDVDDPTSPLVAPKPGDLKKLGVMGIEGLAVGARYLAGDMKGGLAEQASRGIKIGQDSPVLTTDVLFDSHGKPIKDSGPGTSFGGNPPSHYGFVQRRMEANIERTKGFPNIVIWTSHERSAQDKISGEKLVGPEVFGEAITASMSRQFNNTLHFTTATKLGKLKDEHTEKQINAVDVEYRVYTRDHFHPDGQTFVKYKAVSRSVSESQGMPLYLTSDVPGQPVLDFYQKIADIRRARVEALKAKGKSA